MLNTCQPIPTAINVVNQLARQAHRTIRAWQEADIAGREHQADLLIDRLSSLESEASWHLAGRPEAALFHLCIIGSLADSIRNDAACAGFSRNVDPKYAAIERMLRSVASYIERTTGVKREDFGFEYYMDDRCAGSVWGLYEASAS